MLKIIERKALAIIFTFIIVVLTYSFIFYIFFDSGSEIWITLLPILIVGLLCGGIISLVIEYNISFVTNSNFVLNFALYLLAAIILQSIFVKSSFFEIMFYIVLPIAICFFFLDELLKKKISL